MQWWSSLQTSISLVFLVFLLIISVIVIFELLSIGKSLIYEESLKIIRRTGNEVVAKLQGRLLLTESLTTSLAHLGESLPRDKQTFTSILPNVMNYEGKASFIAGGGIWPEPFAFDPQKERRSFFWGRDQHGQLTYFDNYNNADGPGYHGEEWYVPAKFVEQGSSFWSKSYMDPYSFQPMVTCSVPMVEDGQVTGVATVDLKLEGLGEFFAEAANLTGGYVFAVDRNNKFLSFPKPNMVKTYSRDENQNIREEFIYFDDLVREFSTFTPLARAMREINVEIISAAEKSANFSDTLASEIENQSYQIDAKQAELIAAVLSDPLRKGLATDALIKSFTIENDFFLGEKALVHIFLVPATYWKIAIVTPYRQAVAASTAISTELLQYLLIGTLFCFVIMFLVTRKLLIVPLQKMTNTLADHRSGEGGFDIRLDDSAQNELGKLAKQFNNLNATLSSTFTLSQENETKYRTLFENLQDLYFRIDGTGKFEMASPSIQDILGCMPDEVTGKKFIIEFFRQPECWEDFFRELKQKGSVANYEAEFLRKDRTPRWVAINARIITDHAGNMSGVEGMIRDIDERKSNMTALNALQQHLQNILDSMPSLLISVNDNRRITLFNSAASRITGISPENALHRPLMEALPYLEKYTEYYPEIIKSRAPLEFHRETIAELPKRFFNVTLFPLISNGVDGLVILLDDISDLERKEHQLLQAQKMETIGTLAGGIAHDFNNILGSIIGSVSLLKYKSKKKELTVEEIAPYLDTMELSGERMTTLVKQLLTLTRKQEFTFAPVDLNLVIKNVMTICNNSLDKAIQLAPVYHHTTAVTQADPVQIEQVVLNLCINAAHAMTIMRPQSDLRGGKLSVMIEEVEADRYFCLNHPEASTGQYWKLTVADTGVGMESKTIAKIFDPFFTTKERDKGTGLGLATSYNIIKQHGGFIDVYSEPGNGSVFHLYFKKFSQQTNQVTIPAETIVHGKGMILVIDDEQGMREIGASMLEECGYDVISAENGLLGLQLYKDQQQDISCVLLDMVMPVMAGVETFRELKLLNPECKIILTSGFKEDNRVKTVMEMGADYFIQKPYTLNKLSTAFAAVLTDNHT